MPAQTTGTMKPIVISASAFAVVWCAAVAWRLSNLVQSSELDAARFAILIAHQVMGLFFLGCGWAVYTRLQGQAGVLFILYTICTAMHWAGPYPADTPLLKTALLLGFFLVSSTLGEALLVHFTLTFPRPWPIAARKGTLWALYGPMIPAVAVSGAIVVTQATGGDPNAFMGIFALFAFLLPHLMGLLAIIILLIRWAKAGTRDRSRLGLTVMAFGNVLAILPWLAAAAIENLIPGLPVPGGLGTDPYVLAFVLIPLSFLYAASRVAKDSAAGRAP